MSKGPIGVLTRGYRETIDILIEKLISARIEHFKLKQEHKEIERNYIDLTEKSLKVLKDIEEL